MKTLFQSLCVSVVTAAIILIPEDAALRRYARAVCSQPSYAHCDSCWLLVDYDHRWEFYGYVNGKLIRFRKIR